MVVVVSCLRKILSVTAVSYRAHRSLRKVVFLACCSNVIGRLLFPTVRDCPHVLTLLLLLLGLLLLLLLLLYVVALVFFWNFVCRLNTRA